MIARMSLPVAGVHDPSTERRVQEAVADIRRHWAGLPEVGLILGTGLGDLAEEIDADVALPYGDIQHFPCSTAVAHKGQLVCGQLAGQTVVAMQGRCHLYEGYSVANVTLPVRVMQALGIRTLIVSNAAGGLNPLYEPGDIMLIDDHINLMWVGGGAPALPEACGRVPRLGRRLYDAELLERAQAIARRADFVAQRGVYVGVTGPTYETRAEYRMFRRLGADCVGMSTVPETLVAAVGGVRVLGISTVTNVARPDTPMVVSSDEVVNVAQHVQPKLRALVMGLLASFG
jgi:purine-nucleoside phosphorylase